MEALQFFEQSSDLARHVLPMLDVPLYESTSRSGVSRVCCALSLEHWQAVMCLIEGDFLPSGLVLHRVQYEALVRGVWAFYAASDAQIGKLSEELSSESEEGARHLPTVKPMLESLSRVAPDQLYQALLRFKDAVLPALNSFTHTGIHPIQRHASGYPSQLVEGIARNANAIAVVSAMQMAVLAGSQDLMSKLATLQHSHASCLPPHVAA